MTWSTPLTAVTNTALTAAQWNASVRDNLLETAAAKATTAGRIFVATGANTLAEREIAEGVADALVTTTSTSWTSLSGNPAVTVTTGTQALVFLTSRMNNSSTGPACLASFAISGATTAPADDAYCVLNEGNAAASIRAATTTLIAVTAGSNTFTMRYRVASNTGSFQWRRILVMAL